MNPTRKLFLAPVLAVALAGAGCGSSEDNDFIESYNAATQPLTELTDEHLRLSRTERASSKMATGLDDVKAKLAALDAPDDAQDELDALVASIDDEHRRGAQDGQGRQVPGRRAADARRRSRSRPRAQKLVQAEEALRAAVEG